MTQFIIHAKDFTDAEAPARRANARPFHLQRMKEEKQKGIFILGGALLNEQNGMIGSVIIVALPDIQSVESWIQQDPYVINKVWDEITITPFRVADV